MNARLSALFACLVCLILASTLCAQDEISVKTDTVIRLYSPNLPADVNAAVWAQTGELGVLAPIDNTNKATPGPAPTPYPVPMVWEQGIEQLGLSSDACDGICFVNGPLLVPGKWMLVLWTVRIPTSAQRLTSEFARDLTLQLWVDWNENKAWEQRERMLVQNLNIQNLVPAAASYLEVQYLTSFRVPTVAPWAGTGGGGVTKYNAKLWIRCGLTYDDNDAAPMGDALFGEYEDYLVNYQEIQPGTKTKG